MSTVDVKTTAIHMTNIKTVNNSICISHNKGVAITKTKGKLFDLMFEFWLNEDGIANIESLKTLWEHYCMTNNCKERRDRLFQVPTDKGALEFLLDQELHYQDMDDSTKHEIMMVTNIWGNYE